MTTNKGLSSDIRTYISIFSSAGMGCYGIKLEGYECIATCKLLERRIKMQSYNNKCRYKSGYISGDITQQETQDRILEQYANWKKHHQIKDIDVVIATPPSQGMSIANHKKCVSYQTETRTADFLNGTVNPDAFMRTPMDETTGLDEDELGKAAVNGNTVKLDSSAGKKEYRVETGAKCYLWLVTRMGQPAFKSAPGLEVIQTYNLYPAKQEGD